MRLAVGGFVTLEQFRIDAFRDGRGFKAKHSAKRDGLLARIDGRASASIQLVENTLS